MYTLTISSVFNLANVIHVPNKINTETKEPITEFLWDGKPTKIA